MKYKAGDNVIVQGKEVKIISAYTEKEECSGAYEDVYRISVDGLEIEVYEGDIEREAYFN